MTLAMYRAGYGLFAIAEALTHDGIPCPGVPRVFRTGSFVANSCGELPVLELGTDLMWGLVAEF